MDDQPVRTELFKEASLLLLLVSFALVTAGPDALYPYGQEQGDGRFEHIGSTDQEVQLPIPVNFYGQRFQTAYISKDGLVAFAPGLRYTELSWHQGTPNHAIDLPFIAPFHYNGYVPLGDPAAYPGQIYFKLYSRARNVAISEEEKIFMDNLDTYLTGASVVLKTGFVSEFVLKVTWENVSNFQCTDDKLRAEGCPSNTFQLVLVGNLNHTFAVFNYYKMEIPTTDHQLAGVNGGHGRGWTDVVPCTGHCTRLVKTTKGGVPKSLATRYGSDKEGRFILVAGDDVIIRGGCLQADWSSAEMEVYPRQAGMFGGEMLAVSGTCQQPGTKIFCGFGAGYQYRTEGVMETKMRGRCPVPILTTRGEIPLGLSVDNKTFHHQTKITIALPSRLPSQVETSSFYSAWFEIDPQSLRIQWDSQLFTSDRNARVVISLIGYRENGANDNQLVIQTLVEFTSQVWNTEEEYTVDPSQFRCTSSCEDFEVGLIQVRLLDEFVNASTKYQFINLGPVALGWYVNTFMKQKYGTDWASDKCLAWNNQDQQESQQWHSNLLPCPCTLSQALADWGRWQPDMGCNLYKDNDCVYHIGAKHCVRSVQPTSDGAGNQCCYSEDDNLLYAADTYQGSTPDRSHDWGATPYSKPGYVPSLSHWIDDVIPFYYCCLWVEEKDCQYYMNMRATRDCKAYTPPHSGAVVGDNYIYTFDNRSYHFGGSGEFWMLQSSILNIQGRFEERKIEYLQINGSTIAPTNLTSVVMWIEGSDVVTVKRAISGGKIARNLDVLVGTQRRFFTDSSQLWQDFKQVSIVCNSSLARNKYEEGSHSNFTVLFKSGAAVQVAEQNGLLNVVVILPPTNQPTQGLLGTLDGNAANDFKTPEGTIIPSDASEQTIYQNFALKWNVLTADSKFQWPKALEGTKLPLFGPPKDFPYINPGLKPAESAVLSACGTSQPCIRQYYTTTNEYVGRTCKDVEKSFIKLQNSQVTVRSCGLLDIPMAKKTPTVYTEGSVVTVTGCRPDNSPVQSSGPLTYHCNATQDASSGPRWVPEPQTNFCPYTMENVQKESNKTGMLIGIVIAVVVVVVGIIILVVFLIRRRSKSHKESIERPGPVPTKRNKDAPTDDVEPGTRDPFIKQKAPDSDAVRMSDVKQKLPSEAV